MRDAACRNCASQATQDVQVFSQGTVLQAVVLNEHLKK